MTYSPGKIAIFFLKPKQIATQMFVVVFLFFLFVFFFFCFLFCFVLFCFVFVFFFVVVFFRIFGEDEYSNMTHDI